MDSYIYTKLFNLMRQMPSLHTHNLNHEINRSPLYIYKSLGTITIAIMDENINWMKLAHLFLNKFVNL